MGRVFRISKIRNGKRHYYPTYRGMLKDEGPARVMDGICSS